MADTDWSATHALIEGLKREPYRFDFFQALRLIESVNADKPRLGTGLKASDDPIRLGQLPEMDFAPATLSAYEPGASGVDRLLVRFLGLFGPNGPLPLHLTEYARERSRHHKDPTFNRFADVFHHRMLCLFYRAWANSRPEVSLDRPSSDRFGFYVGSLIGVGLETFHDRDALPDRAKLYYAGIMAAQTKHPDGLLALIADYFKLKVSLQEFVGEWMHITPTDQSRLGISPHLASLGQSTIVGARVWGCQHKFRLTIGPLSLNQYRALLPGGNGLRELVAAVRNYAGDELAWDVNLILSQEEVPTTSLDGATQLGWTSWMGHRDRTDDATDLMLNPFFSIHKH